MSHRVFADVGDDRESACHSELTIGRPAKVDKVSDNTDSKSEHLQVHRWLFATVVDTPELRVNPNKFRNSGVRSAGYGNYKIASCEGRSAGNDHGARV